MQEEILDEGFYASEANTHKDHMRPNVERANSVIYSFYALLGCILLVSVVSIIALPSQDEFIVEDELLTGILGLTYILYVVAYITVIILFCQWFRRAYKNIQLLGYNTQYTDGWAVGGFFVPILNLFRPYKIMQEIWQTMSLHANNHNIKHSVESGIYNWWWAFFLINGFISRITSKINNESDYFTTHEIYANLVNFSVEIVAIIFAVLVIQRVRDTEISLRDTGF